MIEVKITATSVADFREQLTELLAGTGVTTAAAAPATAPKTVKNTSATPATPAPAATPAAPAATPAATPTPNASGKEVKVEDLRKAWQEKKDAGVKVDKLKTLLGTYNAESISTLAPENMEAALADIQKLAA